MPDRNEDLIRAAYAALNQGDIEAFLSLVDPDVEFRSLVAEADGQLFRGHEGVRGWWVAVRDALGGLEFELEEYRGHGDRGLLRLRVTGTVEGVVVAQTMWQAMKVRDGRAYWWQTFRTEREALDALGPAES